MIYICSHSIPCIYYVYYIYIYLHLNNYSRYAEPGIWCEHLYMHPQVCTQALLTCTTLSHAYSDVSRQRVYGVAQQEGLGSQLNQGKLRAAVRSPFQCCWHAPLEVPALWWVCCHALWRGRSCGGGSDWRWGCITSPT